MKDTIEPKAVYYAKPRIEAGYTFRTIVDERPTETPEQVAALMIGAADDCDFTRDLLAEWAQGNVEPDSDAYNSLGYFLAGIGAAMRRAAGMIAKQ